MKSEYRREMQLIIWFALKWVNGELSESTVYDTEPLCATLINGKISEMDEIYEMVNSVKWVNLGLSPQSSKNGKLGKIVEF